MNTNEEHKIRNFLLVLLNVFFLVVCIENSVNGQYWGNRPYTVVQDYIYPPNTTTYATDDTLLNTLLDEFDDAYYIFIEKADGGGYFLSPAPKPSEGYSKCRSCDALSIISKKLRLYGYAIVEKEEESGENTYFRIYPHDSFLESSNSQNVLWGSRATGYPYPNFYNSYYSPYNNSLGFFPNLSSYYPSQRLDNQFINPLIGYNSPQYLMSWDNIPINISYYQPSLFRYPLGNEHLFVMPQVTPYIQQYLPGYTAFNFPLPNTLPDISTAIDTETVKLRYSHFR